MNKELLTVLGCSSSLALLLMTNNSAEANTPKEYVFSAPSSDAETTTEVAEYPWYECGCNNASAEAIQQSDREGEKAIALFGCDCAGCRNLARNWENSNQQVMPQS
jgi:hypothetical protein